MALGLAPVVFAFFFYLGDAYEFVSTGSAEGQRVWQVSQLQLNSPSIQDGWDRHLVKQSTGSAGLSRSLYQ